MEAGRGYEGGSGTCNRRGCGRAATDADQGGKIMSANLQITWRKVGKEGKVALTAQLPDDTCFTDTIDIADAGARKRFVAALCKGRRGINREMLAEQLERV